MSPKRCNSLQHLHQIWGRAYIETHEVIELPLEATPCLSNNVWRGTKLSKSIFLVPSFRNHASSRGVPPEKCFSFPKSSNRQICRLKLVSTHLSGQRNTKEDNHRRGIPARLAFLRSVP